MLLAGLAYAPLLATRLVCGRLARPAAVVGAVAAGVRGVLRVLTLRGLSPGNLLKQLQEAAISFGSNCLEVRASAGMALLLLAAVSLMPTDACKGVHAQLQIMASRARAA